jgi:hypothetical protein
MVVFAIDVFWEKFRNLILGILALVIRNGEKQCRLSVMGHMWWG